MATFNTLVFLRIERGLNIYGTHLYVIIIYKSDEFLKWSGFSTTLYNITALNSRPETRTQVNLMRPAESEFKVSNINESHHELHVPKLLNFTYAVKCYHQKCKLASL